MQKNWIIKPQADDSLVERLAKSINVSKPVANLLAQRGINNYEEAKNFFRPQLDRLYDPFLMKDMHLAVQRLEMAVNNNENVLVYGDYDVDGTTSVAMMYTFLRDKIKNLYYYIPDRYDEGYGISFKGIDFAADKDCSLIVALDCGIKAVEKVDYATEKNIDFIICDHHEPGDELPAAVAVLDPKRRDCDYPFKELSACGVGFKLIQAYAAQKEIPFYKIENYLDLVVVSIAADIVPIVDENRILAYYGLKRVNAKPRIGLLAILDLAKVKPGNLKINDLVFKVGPRINAAGRMEQGKFSVDLLVCKEKHHAVAMAERIDEDNNERKWFDSNITKEALNLIKQDADYENKRATVLYNPEWHKGVIGIVASRVIDYYYKPTIILTRSNGFVTGSARSVSGFNLYQAIEKCKDLLENFGGHMYAAGLTLKEKNVPEFKARFEAVVRDQIAAESLVPKIDVDGFLGLDDIRPKFYKVLSQFEPFGPGNMSPVFVSKAVMDTGYAQLVGPEREHLKMSITGQENGKIFPAIAFRQAEAIDLVQSSQLVDICFSLEENSYKGRTNLQMKVRDIKQSTDKNFE